MSAKLSTDAELFDRWVGVGDEWSSCASGPAELASSSQLLDETRTRLADWAAQLREGLIAQPE